MKHWTAEARFWRGANPTKIRVEKIKAKTLEDLAKKAARSLAKEVHLLATNERPLDQGGVFEAVFQAKLARFVLEKK